MICCSLAKTNVYHNRIPEHMGIIGNHEAAFFLFYYLVNEPLLWYFLDPPRNDIFDAPEDLVVNIILQQRRNLNRKQPEARASTVRMAGRGF